MDYNAMFRKLESKGAEFVDIRLLDQNAEAIVTQNKKVNSIQEMKSMQIGVRVFYKGAWGFAYTNDEKKVERTINKAFKLAKVSSRDAEKFSIKNIPINKDEVKAKGKSPFSVDISEKLKMIFDLYERFSLREIKSKNIELGFTKRNQIYINSFGSRVSEEREYFNFLMVLTGKKGNKLRRSFERIGMVGDYTLFLKYNYDDLIKELEDKLKTYFVAKQAPAGRMPLVLDNVLTHVFFHEAVGHATEADSIIQKSSVLTGKLGEQIAPEFLNLYDTPKIKNEHGFYKYDDEGVKAGKTQLIKRGVLINYLQSLETANKLDMKPTGNGRAQNAFNIQIPRMSNTVLDNGDYSFEELFEGIKRGIYAKNSQGGVVEPTTGNFLFNAREAYLIENGRITKPLLGVSFGGNILETLMKIERIGNDKKPSFGGWRCGKNGQMVPVGGAAPHIMLSEAMVGGNK
jgi:TldD protein